MRRIYLDYAASSPIDKRAAKAMEPYFFEKFGNASALHFFGQEAQAAIDRSREIVAKAIGADFREIVFTASATEANNLALRGIVGAFGNPRAIVLQNRLSARSSGERQPALSARDPSLRSGTELASPARASLGQTALDQKPPRLIISSIEHESVLETARDLEREGAEVVYLPICKDGTVDLEKLKESLNENTLLVSVMYVNNVVGTIQPIAEIARIIKAFREQLDTPYPLLHTDAVQAFQYLDCDVDELGLDLMTLSSHKIYGPKGVGLLYLRGLPTLHHSLQPIITGGGQEFGLRSGTPNTAGIVGFGKAVELTLASRKKEREEIKKLRDYFWKKLKKEVPQTEINGEMSKLSPNYLNVYFQGASGKDLLIKLDMLGVAASLGAACSVRSTKPSYVVSLIYNEKRAWSSLRFTLGKEVKRKDIDETVKKIKMAI